jgi:drug/metabolite transporter (DMT)-like permease
MRWKSDLILLFVAAIWGSGFVAQRLATEQLGTFSFNGGRFLLAALLILPMTRLRWQGEWKQIPWMMLAGTFLFAAAGLQQAGLFTTTIGNASFITGLYVVLVPLILFFFWKKQVHWLSWLAVGIAVIGVMLLSLQGEFRLAPGDGLELMGAVMWALHVLLVGRLASKGANILWFSVIQFTVCGLLNLLLAAYSGTGGCAEPDFLLAGGCVFSDFPHWAGFFAPDSRAEARAADRCRDYFEH